MAERKNKYRVTIVETLTKTVEVEAENEREAEDVVKQRYWNSEYVLTADDYFDTEFCEAKPVRSRTENER